MCRFKHGGDLGDLGCLREPSELIGGHCEIGTLGLIDVMAVNVDKLIVEVVLEWPSLRVKLLLGHRKSNLVCSALRTVDVLVFAGSVFLLGLAVLRGLSALALKITPSRKGERGSSSVVVLAMVFVEPWDSESKFSSRMVWRDALGRRSMCSMLTTSEGWSVRGWTAPT